ncbi:flagellar protein FlaG [Clostridium sp.]|uniref:flagellar protein FlaG n=1 Tax=Clostridium sp. TaxID=1506 RepID=UPI0026226FAA|nr:flagellar protein FlaG [Clostridium sp.]
MDVNIIINNLNQYNNNVSETNGETNSIEISAIPKGNEEQGKTKDNSDKSNSNKDMDKAIDTLNKFLEKDKTHAEYSVYKKLGRTVIKIIDDKTNEVIMEFPKEKILDMVASMLENAGLLDKKA